MERFFKSAKLYFVHFESHRFGVFYFIDESITRLRPPPQFLLRFGRITKIGPAEKGGGVGVLVYCATIQSSIYWYSGNANPPPPLPPSADV